MTGVLLRGVRLGSGGPVRDVRLQDGAVIAIGESVDARTGDEVWHHPDAVLLPGFVDGHVHATQWALRRSRVEVAAARSPQQVADLLLAAVRGDSGQSDGVLAGHGYRDALWAQPPHKDLLETALPGRPVVLVSHDMHSVWLSPAALALLGRRAPDRRAAGAGRAGGGAAAGRRPLAPRRSTPGWPRRWRRQPPAASPR